MPGLFVYRSNRIEALAELLGSILAELPPGPFEPVEVVVGSRGMERWLTHQLAQRLGISANIEFPFPEAKIDSINSQLLDAESNELPVDPWAVDTLCLALLEVLPELASGPGFEPVRGYVAEWQGPADAKQYGLCRQFADVFDRYISYRPELARAWSAAEADAPAAAAEVWSWQQRLWQALCRQLGYRPHRAARMAEAEARLRTGLAPPALRAPLRIFALSSLPPSWMSLLGALSKHIDVDLFLLCPSAEYWADLHRRVAADRAAWQGCDRDSEQIRALAARSGNPLLVSLGRVARDAQIVLEAQPDDYEERRLDLFHDPLDPGRPRALHFVQSDLLAARHPAALVDHPARRLDPGDDSLQLHSCYGPTRQVEVVRDVLLGLLAEHPELEPRDILVMTPDIEKYAPLVTAVFSQGPSSRREQDGKPVLGAEGWGPAGAPRIPFEVADLSVRRLNPVADALLRILEMADGRLEASAVIDLMTLEPVSRRFGIEPEDLPTLQSWIRDSGIRWGQDAEHRARLDQPAETQNTWSFGLRRLLLGVVMADDGRMLHSSRAASGQVMVRPFDAMEGGNTVLLGRLVDFAATLFLLLERLREPRPLGEWVDALDGALEECTATPKDAFWLSRSVREVLDEIRATGKRAGSSRPLSLDAMRSLLAGRFDVASRITKEQSGAVTFCALRPMRSVPYAVVCLLGMDEAAFPRQGERPVFDLVARKPRVGDSSPRDEDRYLMLEAILAAREHLVVLYTGRDPHNNEPCPPCVPVGELCDLLDQSLRAPEPRLTASQYLTTEHPLQSFSPRAFLPLHRDPTRPGSRRAWSFDRRLLEGAKAWQKRLEVSPPFYRSVEPSAAAPQLAEQIRVDELVRFFKNPTEYLLRDRLGIDLSDWPELVPDREPVELGPLQSWQLCHCLLAERLAGRDHAEAAARLRSAGSLPLGYAGQATVELERSLVDSMLAESGLLGAGAQEPLCPDPPVALDVTLCGARITGSLTNVYRGFLIDFQLAASETSKHLASVWLPLLAWHAADPSAGRAVLVLGSHGRSGSKVNLLGYQAPADARQLLAELVGIYQRGIRGPIPLFPRSSWAFAKTIGKLTHDSGFVDQGQPLDPKAVKTLRQAHHAALDAWARARHGADLDDAHIARVYEGQSPLVDLGVSPVPIGREFARLALLLWGPLLAGRQTKKVVQRDWLAGGFR
jgi:exodeoxyribonuclease V gamma subunit